MSWSGTSNRAQRRALTAYRPFMKWWREYQRVWLALLIVAIFVALIALLVLTGEPHGPGVPT